MAASVRDVMARNPVCVSSDTPIQKAAQQMRDEDIGDIILCENERPTGIVTDRDIVVRALADGHNDATVGEIASGDVTTIEPDRPANEAAKVMRQKNIRRLPVVENGKIVGIVSIGDLAIQLDADSALADISAAPGNK